jgi:cardiolipin synthase C
MKSSLFAVLLLAAVTTGCVSQRATGLTSEILVQKSSAWPLEIADGQVFTDNDAAFLSKVRMIEAARKSIDMSYYIFSDDESSSVLTKALLAAARRGVIVRLIVDYETNYNRLDLFSMMEKEGNGNIQVRLYNRPTANIVKDAVFMTMGCSKETAAARPTACSAEKFAAIDKLFADEQIDGVPAAGRNISNLNIGNSGLFLSGLYAKRGDVIALAVQKGEGIDMQEMKGQSSATSPEQKAELKNLGKDYWQARTGALFQRLSANAELFFAFAQYGQQLDPFKETVTSILPVDRKFSVSEQRDWDHFSDYTHHKLLLVDRSAIQMGGRNVENSYHMRPNPLISKYVFMDTDIQATLSQGGESVAQAFENLWNFSDMVATLAEVRQHAPNDFVNNIRNAEKHCAAEKGKSERDACVAQEMETHSQDLPERMADSLRTMEENSRTYHDRYLPMLPAQPASGFQLEKGSVLGYLENLPFNKELPAGKRQRIYGALSGEESKDGKYIHDAWLREIAGVCAAATPGNPKRIVLHNAYFFPAANLTYALSRLVNGDDDCANVTVTVLTNSIGTTDLNVVNLAARHSLKAFTEFYQQNSNPARRAAFEYYEYQPPAAGPNLSLHSKVSVFGDDIIIGSANADVRSFMMDSNNAMLIRNAPEFQRSYLAFVDGILANPVRVKKLNDYFATTSREKMKQEDLATFRLIMAKYGADKKMNAEEQKRVEGQFNQMLDDAYSKTRDSISPELSAAKKQENQNSFNEQFKPI